jgi:hypothetical protein
MAGGGTELRARRPLHHAARVLETLPSLWVICQRGIHAVEAQRHGAADHGQGGQDRFLAWRYDWSHTVRLCLSCPLYTNGVLQQIFPPDFE